MIETMLVTLPSTATWNPEPRRASDPILAVKKPLFSATTSSTNLNIANTELYMLTHGLDQVPRQYRQLISHTESFIETIQFLAKLPGNFDCVAGLLIDFASGILKAKNSCWKHMLNSQRGHIFWMLDDALLSLCVDEWEKPTTRLEKNAEDGELSLTETEWPNTIKPVLARLSRGIAAIPGSVGEEWVSEHERVLGWDWWKIIATEPQISSAMMNLYFARTKKFLADSEGVFWIKKRANACLKGRLPQDLADEVIEGVLEAEGLPSKRLRTIYFPRGNGRLA